MNLRNGLGRQRQKCELFVMASFETMQDLLFLSRTSNFIDDEEFLAHQYVMIVTPRKVWIPEISFNYRKGSCRGFGMFGVKYREIQIQFRQLHNFLLIVCQLN